MSRRSMRIRGAFLTAVVAWAVAGLAVPIAGAAPLQVLVTNDDGYAADGISVLVSRLAANRQVQVHVFAPATNQSGTGSSFTTGPLATFSAATAAGYPVTAVRGFPADGVFFGVRQGLAKRPDLVVSGINFGQNIGAAVGISGTVGAALTAAGLGIPAFAASQGLGPGLRYEETADYVAGLVEEFRTDPLFRRLLRSSHDVGRARVLNINFPTCTTGKLRGVRAVVVGVSSTITGYLPAPSPLGTTVWSPQVHTVPFGSNDCASTLKNPRTDLEAMNNGYASVSLLNQDLSNDERLIQIKRFVQ